MTQESANVTAPPPPQFFVTCPQRDPPIFAGLRGDDVDEWLDNYERASAFNRWDDGAKLKHAPFCLSDVAKNWYLNREGTIKEWSAFTTKIRQFFGSSAALSDSAKKKLEGRVQHPQETYTSYIEDVLALCRKVNRDMPEAERVRHILKGIGQFAFNALVLQNPASVSDVTTACQRLEDLQSIRLQQDTSSRNIGDYDLRALIRAIIREELQDRASSCAAASPHCSAAPNLREIIKEELAASIPSRAVPHLAAPLDAPSYSEVAGRPPLNMAPITPQPLPGYVAAIPSGPAAQSHYSAWRPQRPEPPVNRPVCFYCGIRGHISRFCRRRLQAERRGYDAYERDEMGPRFGYRQRGYRSPPRRFSPPPDSYESPRNARESRRRSPSPFRRAVSPLRPVVHDSTHLPEN